MCREAVNDCDIREICSGNSSQVIYTVITQHGVTTGEVGTVWVYCSKNEHGARCHLTLSHHTGGWGSDQGLVHTRQMFCEDSQLALTFVSLLAGIFFDYCLAKSYMTSLRNKETCCDRGNTPGRWDKIGH